MGLILEMWEWRCGVVKSLLQVVQLGMVEAGQAPNCCAALVLQIWALLCFIAV